MGITISIPSKLYERLVREGLDVESLIVDLLIDRLGIDPIEGAEAHLELAERFFNEGIKAVDKDPVQASEKFYKVAEECVKAAAILLEFKEVFERVMRRGRWRVVDLEEAARLSASKLGEDFYVGWDRANYLHVWSFHEAKLNSDAVRARIPYIERMLKRLKEEVIKRKQ